MVMYDDAVQAFWDKYPSEQGWNIRIAVSNGDTLTVSIHQHGTTITQSSVQVGPQDSVLRKVETAVLQAIHQVEAPPAISAKRAELLQSTNSP